MKQKRHISDIYFDKAKRNDANERCKWCGRTMNYLHTELGICYDCYFGFEIEATAKENREMLGWHDRTIVGRPQTVLCSNCAEKRGDLRDDDWQNVTGEGWKCDDCGHQDQDDSAFVDPR
ncbi:MAG: hypothetical protein WC547_04180 [Candidatus Omnitrophota bacterium]